MQHDSSWAVHLATKGFVLIILLGIRRKHSGYPLSEIFFFLILTAIVTESFNIHFSRITWFETTPSFLLGYAPNFINVPLLYCWHWVKSFLAATLFHNFQNVFQTIDREQRKLILTRFNLEKILSSLTLETLTMNNNLIINSTSLFLVTMVAPTFSY